MNKMKTTMKYVGVGARNCPTWVKDFAEKTGQLLAMQGLELRTGGSLVVDQAFERGCDKVNGSKNVFLAWEGYYNNKTGIVVDCEKSFDIAREVEKNWRTLTLKNRQLRARNVYQLLGENLDQPANFVVCYTKDGNVTGATGNLIKLADKYNVPVFNIGDYANDAECLEAFKLFAIKHVVKAKSANKKSKVETNNSAKEVVDNTPKVKKVADNTPDMPKEITSDMEGKILYKREVVLNNIPKVVAIKLEKDKMQGIIGTAKFVWMYADELPALVLEKANSKLLLEAARKAKPYIAERLKMEGLLAPDPQAKKKAILNQKRYTQIYSGTCTSTGADADTAQYA